jgi:multidrug efflux pump subunit AcrA (membrane-fusion protein)
MAVECRRFTSANRVKKGDPLFKMDSTRQEASLEAGRARVAEVDASAETAEADIADQRRQTSGVATGVRRTADQDTITAAQR